MTFAFNPDDGPARLIRYVEPGTLPSNDLLALYDAKQNLLLIRRDYFDRLPELERHRVLRTQLPYIEVVFKHDELRLAA